jgi:uncharacterized tellurite resistance protein B-like protein
MINRIKAFFDDRGAEPAEGDHHSVDELQLAAAALLVEAARMDDRVDEHERARIHELLRWRFGLDEAEADLLIEAAIAETARSAQLHGYAEMIRAKFDEGERVRLVELLWDVTYADGELHELEASLMRRIAGLLYVSDRDSGTARKRAMARHGIAEGG